MNRNGIIAVIILLTVLVLAAGFAVYSYYQSQAQPLPLPVPPIPQANFPQDIITDWGAISQKLPLKAAESGKWYVDAIRTISSSTALTAFEDGLNGHVAVISQNSGIYEVKKIYESQLQFTASELDAIQKQYGDPNYTPRNFHLSEGNGRLIEDNDNLFLKSPSATMNVKIAWLDPSGELPSEVKPGDISGCDHVVLQTRTVTRTQAPLTAALNELLKDKSNSTPGNGLYNYIANGNLKLASVTIQNGIAKIYLTGTPPPLAGVCDDPRLFIQVAQTARQFPSVQDVFLWVNGVLQNQPPDPDASQ